MKPDIPEGAKFESNEDLWYTLASWPINEVVMGFALLPIVTYDEAAGHGYRDANGHPTVTDPRQADADAKGSVKFDGCSNVGFDSAVMLHFCGRRQVRNLAKALEWAYDEAKARGILRPDMDDP